MLKGVRPGERVCAISGLAVYQGKKQASHMAIIALEGRRPEDRERFLRVAKYGGLTGLRVEHADESLVLASPLPSGTLNDFPALGWRLSRRLDVFAALARLFKGVHATGQAVGPLPPTHIFLDDKLMPFFLGPGIGEVRDAKGVFAAPETGKDGRNDVVSDIFVLGRLLHFVLLQKQPTVEQVLIPRLDELAALPAGLTRIVRKCTSGDRAQRYPSVDALLADFGRYGDYEQVGLVHAEARELNIGRESRPPVGRSPVPVTTPRVGGATNPRMPTNPRMSIPNARASQTKLSPPPAPRKPGPLNFNTATRWTCLLVGLLVAAAPFGLVFVAGYDFVLLVLAIAGAALFGLGLVSPEARGESGWRLFLAVVLAAPLYFLNPLPELAIRSARQNLASPALATRAKAFRQLLALGEKRFFALDLTNGSVASVRIVGCDLSQVSFENAVLKNALIHSTKLSGTKFGGAHLEGAVFESTSADATIGFERATCDESTRLPAHWRCEEAHPVRADASPTAVPAAAPTADGGVVPAAAAAPEGEAAAVAPGGPAPETP